MNESIEIEELASLLKVLGEPTRLKMFQYLCNCCNSFEIDSENNIKGISVGEICCQISGKNNITSTMSHHLKELRYSGLINMQKKGKNVLYSINRKKAILISKYLSNIISPCCGGN